MKNGATKMWWELKYDIRFNLWCIGLCIHKHNIIHETELAMQQHNHKLQCLGFISPFQGKIDEGWGEVMWGCVHLMTKVIIDSNLWQSRAICLWKWNCTFFKRHHSASFFTFLAINMIIVKDFSINKSLDES